MRKFALAVVLCGAVMGLGSPVFALTVSPARVEITGDPGTTVQSEIELFNEQSDSRTFFSSFENFEPSGDSGAPHFVGGADGLATWFRIEEKVTLSSGQRKKIPFSITIPKDAEPGGHFAAIFFGSQPPKTTDGGTVSIGGKIGILVLLRVSGDIAEAGGLVDFSASNGKRLFTTLPVNFEYRISNGGGDRIVPRGDITIRNTIRLKAATLLVNEKEGSVLPNSTRKFSATWGTTTEEKVDDGFWATVSKQWRDFHVGWYTARMHVTWGETQQSADASYHFFMFPWQLLLLILGVVVVVGGGGCIGIQKYNRMIIAQAMRK